MKKILWVKFGWSELYRGGQVDGNFGWLNAGKGKKNKRLGHEAFNFSPGPDGTYYCHVPPQKGEYAPSNSDPNGWTVICLAKNPKHKGIHVIGWYENATLHGDWLKLPTPVIAQRGGPPPQGDDWTYSISSKSAYFIPREHRTTPFSDNSVRQGKYSFLDGPNVKSSESKKRVLKLLEGRLEALKTVAVKNPSEKSLPDPEIDAVDPLKGFGTPEHRKKVEKAAERAVIARYEAQGFKSDRVTHLPCGYDFVFTKGKSVRHVEVKGTSSATPQFFLTRNEHSKGMRSNPSWRLAMVTSALSDAPKVTEYDARELARAFDLEPYVYIAKFVPTPESS